MTSSPVHLGYKDYIIENAPPKLSLPSKPPKVTIVKNSKDCSGSRQSFSGGLNPVFIGSSFAIKMVSKFQVYCG